MKGDRPASPLSHLRRAHGSEVVVKLKNGTEILGRLLICDDMMNLVLSSASERDPDSKKLLRNVGDVFIRGNNILFVTLEE